MVESRIQISTFLRYGLLGTAIAFAGPPIYIHAPKFYTDTHGLTLTTIGAILLGVRMIDFVQDPALGWLAARYPRMRRIMALAFGGALLLGMVCLFSSRAPLPPAVWLVLSSILVFTGFSGLQILYYSSGVKLADLSQGGHANVAMWRESGVLIGVCAAAVLPSLWHNNPGIGYQIYTASFAALLVFALAGMHSIWPLENAATKMAKNCDGFLKDRKTRALFVVGLLNTLPVGITSTVFLYFVADRLQSEAQAGLMLLTFFLAAGLSVPFWSFCARRAGFRASLLSGMVLSILAFSFALGLRADTSSLFYLVCVASGAAVGADLTLLPAMLSHRLAEIGASAEFAFGIWGFLTKFSLAFAAGIALPALAAFGYEPSGRNSEDALNALSLIYAGLPCVLKGGAVAALFFTPQAEESPA